MMKRIREKKPLFMWRYLILFALVFMSFSCVLFPLRSRVMTDTYNTLIREKREMLSGGMTHFSAQVRRLYHTSSILSDSEPYKELQRLSASSLKESVTMNKMKKELVKHLLQQDDYVSGCFVQFSNNRLFIGNFSSAFTNDELYGKLFKFQDVSEKELRERIFRGTDAISIWPKMKIENEYYPQITDVIPVIVQCFYTSTSIPSGAVCWLIHSEMLLPAFVDEDFLKSGYFCLTDSEGRILLEEGAFDPGMIPQKEMKNLEFGGELYDVVHVTSEEYSISAYAMVPHSLMLDQVYHITRLMQFFIFLGAIGAVLMVFMLVAFHYLPVKRLLSITQSYASPSLYANNSFDYIGNTLKSVASAKNEAEKKLALVTGSQLNHILLNTCLGSPCSHEEKQLLLEHFDSMLEGFQVVFMKLFCVSEAENLLRVATIEETLRGHLSVSMFMLYPDQQTAIAFVKSGEKDLVAVVRKTVSAVALGEGAVLRAGVSREGSGLKHLHAGYVQAVSAVNAPDDAPEKTAVLFEESMHRAAPEAFDPASFTKLNDIVLAGSRSDVKSAFDQILGAAPLPERITYKTLRMLSCIHMVLNSASAKLSPQANIEEIVFAVGEKTEDAVNALLEYAYDICRIAEEKSTGRTQKLTQAIIEYIHENYSDINLSADSIASQFHLSRNYVQKFVKETTGRTLNDFIETARIAEAKRFLSETGWTVDEISRRTGYDAISSFYRVFKKRTGVSPGSFRDSLSDEAEKDAGSQ